MHFLRFDADEKGQVILQAHWMVQSSDGRTVYAQRIADIRKDVAPGDFEAIAAGQSETLGQLSRDIAKVIPAKR